MSHQPLLTDPRIAHLGRLKPFIVPPEPGDLVRLLLIRKALVYKRLSTHEQRKKSIWSLEMQDALFEQARADGYREDQIIVEDRDLGISGTKGREDRPGLAALIQAIEADEVEAVYVVHISRISRDQTLIDGLEFGELCKRHRVLIVMPTMRLNLRDSMHMRLYRQEIERAADEIELLKLRLGGPKRHKALSGRFDGRSVAAGYLLDHEKDSESYERYVLYPPHAEVVRAIFRAVITAGTPTRAARWLRDRGVLFPEFGPDLPPEDVSRCSLGRHLTLRKLPEGISIAPKLIRSIATNPVYLGWWVVDGQVVQTDNHPAIIDEETFLLAQEVMTEQGRGAHGRRRGWREVPQLLTGMLWCGRHEIPAPMSASLDRRQGRYQCDQAYALGRSDHRCSILNSQVLDEPLTDLVLRRCSFAEHAEAVLTQIEAEYDTAREDARHRTRELTHLQHEVETLKENLALTRSPAQVTMIFEQIDQRMARMKLLADEANSPVGRVLTAAQVATVKAFLADLRVGWAKQPPELRHELFRLLLERVVLEAQRDHVVATVVWRSGAQQQLWIERPASARAAKHPWIPPDQTWLAAHYATASWEELQTRFPERSLLAIRKHAALLGLERSQAGRPKPPRVLWTPDEYATLRAYAAGQISLAELQARLPGRPWDGILYQLGRLGLRRRARPVYYRVLLDTRDMVATGDSSALTDPVRRW